MNKTHKEKLKGLMGMFKTSQGAERENYKQAILAYLDAVLDI